MCHVYGLDECVSGSGSRREVPQAANSVSGSTASGAHEVVIEGEPEIL